MWDIAQIITMRCIGKCPYCMYGSKLNQIQEVSLQDLATFYQQIPDELYVKITGGEPLQPNNVARTLAFIQMLKKDTQLIGYQLNTNGAWGIPNVLLADKMCTIQVSCDGPAAYQNACYGQNYFDKLLNTLSLFKTSAARGKIMMVVTEQTKQYIDYVAALAYSNNMAFNSQWVSPVDLAKTSRHKPGFSTMRQIERRYGVARNPNAFCPHRYATPEKMYLSIDAQGNIINCPILSSIKTGLTIYNSTPKNAQQIIDGINKALGDCTCQFPAGLSSYIAQLNAKELVHLVKNIPETQKEGLKDVFGIDL